MRKKIVAGNWKMNTDLNQAIDLTTNILNNNSNTNVQIILFPPSIFIQEVVKITKNSKIKVGAQNCSNHNNGAFTGEISAAMITSVGGTFSLIGHSERRIYFKESNPELATKINQCLNNSIHPIYCCGEVLEERNTNVHFKIIEKQINEGLFHLNEEQILSIVVAYEPVWAIGTGVTATPAQAQEIHGFIRGLLAKQYGVETANEITILYGGSCNANNANELFALPDVDGGLIGGASLKHEDFIGICNSF